MSEQLIIEWLRQIYLPSLESQNINVSEDIPTSNLPRTNHRDENNRQHNLSNIASFLGQSVHRIPENTQPWSEGYRSVWPPHSGQTPLRTTFGGSRLRDPLSDPNTTHSEGDFVSYGRTPMEQRGRVWSQNRMQSEEPRNQSQTSTRLSFPEFDELMYLYHRNVQEYQYTIQDMTERLETNTRRNSRQQNMILDNLMYPYNRNMQEYNQVTLRCLDVLQNMYALSTDERRRISEQRPTNTTVPVQSDASTTFTDIPPTSNRNPVQISRPVEFGFTLFPNIIHLPRNTNTSSVTPPILLTPEQIARTTREYIFREIDRNTLTSAPICPIMLEEFQPGNNIRQIIHCGHHFLSSSLTRWFRRSSCCPVCRYNLWDISAQDPQLFTGRTTNTAMSSSLVPDLRSNSRANSIGDIVPVSREELRQTSSLINSYFSGHYPLDRETNTSTSGTNRIDIQRAVQRPEPNSVQEQEPLEPSEGDTPFLDLQSTNMEGAETSIRNWITSFINSNQPGMFPNMDLDISYTVEYDFPIDSSGQMTENSE